MRAQPYRADVPVSDRTERLDAEEERAQEGTGERDRLQAPQRSRSAEEVEARKQHVDRHVPRAGQGEKPGPRQVQQRVIEADRRPEWEALADYVEAAVAIDQPLPALLRDHRAEAQVAIVVTRR